jgi:hypothetical protein
LRPVFALFILELSSRRVVHVGVTRSPTGPGRPSSCARRRRRGADRASSSTTTTPRTAPSSTASPRPAGSR